MGEAGGSGAILGESEWIQRGHGNGQELEEPGWRERLGELGPSSLEETFWRPDDTWEILEEWYREAFSRNCRDRRRGNSFQLKEGAFRLDKRRKRLAGVGGGAMRSWRSCGCPTGLEQPGLL